MKKQTERKLIKSSLIKAAVLKGLLNATKSGYKKPFDIAMIIELELEINFTIGFSRYNEFTLAKADKILDELLDEYKNVFN